MGMNMTAPGPAVELVYVILFSALFCVISLIGIVGNVLVIYVIFSDPKMRTSKTNMLITNLAIADFLILILGIPEIVQFMMNRGWLLGPVLCKTHRTVLVASLYASVLTLVALSIER
jgi:thyrotropin-releasing hormone receptor